MNVGMDSALDWLFGYDFFISYAHDDGSIYPETIRNALVALGYKVFLDTDVYVVGTPLAAATQRRVKMSRHLIVIAGPKALRSSWVAQEVALHLAQGLVPLVIDPEATLSKEAVTPLSRQIMDGNWLRIDEPVPLACGAPSPETISALDRAFKSSRQDTKRRRIFAAVALGIAGAIAIAGYAWKVAKDEELAASIRTANALTARAEEARNTRRFRAAGILALAATAARRDGVVSVQTARVLRDAAVANLVSIHKLGEPFTDAVRGLAFRHGSNEVAIAANDGTVKFFDPVSWKITRTLTSKGTYVSDLVFLDGGRRLLTVTAMPASATTWDIDASNNVSSPLFDPEDRSYFDVAVSSDHKQAVIGATDNSVILFNLDAPSEAVAYRPKSHTFGPNDWDNNINDVAISKDGRYIAIATSSNTAEIIKSSSVDKAVIIDSFERRSVSGGNSDRVNVIDFAHDNTVLTGSFDGDIERWHPETGELQEPIIGPLPSMSVNYKSIDALAMSPSGKMLLSGARNGDVLLREVETGTVRARLFSSLHPINAVAFSDDGAWIATGGDDAIVWVWPLAQAAKPNVIDTLCARMLANGSLTPEALSEVELRFGQPIPNVCSKSHREKRVPVDVWGPLP